MSSHLSRRDILKASAASAFALPIVGLARGQKQKQKVRFACIGVGGKGDSDTADAARLGEVVAICDADMNVLAEAAKKYPNAKTFTDYRIMYSRMGKDFDAVTVSTPDHNHALASAIGIQMGKHIYCQKPLTRLVWEARWLTGLAQKHKVATQMGNQGTANDALRQAAYWVRSGALGIVKEVHVWTDRAAGWWPQGVGHPEPHYTPNTIDWDAWLGPAPIRHFSKAYHPFAWRGFWDFGSGALGDMGCHVLNLPHMALDLRDPIAIRAEVSQHSKEANVETFPLSSTVYYEFPARGARPAINLIWYDGGRKPSPDLAPGNQYPGGGVIIVGDKDTLYVPSEHGSGAKLLKNAPPQTDFPKSPGHFEELIIAIETGKPAMSAIPEYSGPFTETVVLGNLAIASPGQRLEWDAANMRVKGHPELDSVIKPVYREGWNA
jgi:predicted dehydrogenase